MKCEFCGSILDEDKNPADIYYNITAWVRGPKKDGAVLRDYTGQTACVICIRAFQAGQPAGSPTLFDEQVAPINTVEPEITEYVNSSTEYDAGFEAGFRGDELVTEKSRLYMSGYDAGRAAKHIHNLKGGADVSST